MRAGHQRPTRFPEGSGARTGEVAEGVFVPLVTGGKTPDHHAVREVVPG